MRGDEPKAFTAFLVAGKEDGDAGYKQRLWQLENDGVDKRAKVRLGVEIAAEADKCLAVVKALGIEDAIDPGLDPVLERIEEQARDDDRRDEAPGAQTGEARVHNLGRERDDD